MKNNNKLLQTTYVVLLFLSVLVFLMAISVNPSFAQAQGQDSEQTVSPNKVKLTVEQSGLTLKDLARIIEKRTAYKVRIWKKARDSNLELDLHVRGVSLFNLLKGVLRPENLSFSFYVNELAIHSPSRSINVSKNYYLDMFQDEINPLPPTNFFRGPASPEVRKEKIKIFPTLCHYKDIDSIIDYIVSGSVSDKGEYVEVNGKTKEHRRIERLLRRMEARFGRNIQLQGEVYRVKNGTLRDLRSGICNKKETERIRNRLNEKGSLVHKFSKHLTNGVPKNEAQLTSEGFMKDVDPKVATSRVIPDPNIGTLAEGTGFEFLCRWHEARKRLQVITQFVRNQFTSTGNRVVTRKIGEYRDGDQTVPAPKEGSSYKWPIRKEHRVQMRWNTMLKTDQALVLNGGPVQLTSGADQVVLLLEPSVSESLVNLYERIKNTNKKKNSASNVTKEEIKKQPDLLTNVDKMSEKTGVQIYVTPGARNTSLPIDSMFNDRKTMNGYTFLKEIAENSDLALDEYPNFIVLRKEKQPSGNAFQDRVFPLHNDVPIEKKELPHNHPTVPFDQDVDDMGDHRHGDGGFIRSPFSRNKKTKTEKFLTSVLEKLRSVDFDAKRGDLNREGMFLLVRQKKNVLRNIEKRINDISQFPVRNTFLQVNMYRFPATVGSDISLLNRKDRNISSGERKKLRTRLKDHSDVHSLGSWLLTPGSTGEKVRASTVTSYSGIVDYDIQVATDSVAYDPIPGSFRTGVQFKSWLKTSERTENKIHLDVDISKKTGPIKTIDNKQNGEHFTVPITNHKSSFSWPLSSAGHFLNTFRPFSPDTVYLIMVSVKQNKIK